MFDGNFRPGLWGRDIAQARAAYLRTLSLTDLALMTFDDERMLWGDACAEESTARCHTAGVAEVVIKRGAEPCLIWSEGQITGMSIPQPIARLVTTAAGDSFNAGFISVWLEDSADLVSAAISWHRLAGKVIRHRGAILPAAELAALRRLRERAS